jgi:hypothetical protein
MSQPSKNAIRFQVGAQLVEEHGLDPGDSEGHRLTVGRLRVNHIEAIEGLLPGTFVEGTTTALGDGVGGLGTTTAYPVYKFAEGSIFGWQVVEFVQRAEGELAAIGTWHWRGGTGAFLKIQGEGSLEAKVVRGPDDKPRRVVDYVGSYWFE